MKTLKYVFLFTVLAVFTNCSEDDNPEIVTQVDSRLFTIASFNNSGVFGSANFIKNSNNTVTIQLNLVGTTDAVMHPAHIHFNTAAETGAIAISLVSVSGTTGQSETTFSTLDDGTPISYEALLDFDGYIAIHQSPSNNAIVAQSDIGQNELTDNSVSYPLTEVDLTDVSGTITFTERVNGEALAEISLSGTPSGGVHPTHIHAGSVATAPGAILFTFTSVDGTSGTSSTNIDALDDGTPFGYSDILTVDGYVNVHLSATNLGFLVAQGNIGAN